MPTNKYFKCPFCDKRLTREDMVRHIEKYHEDELPEGFTALRATFHAVNRKDFSYVRPCRMCKSPTKWDESKGRYDQLCGSKACYDAQVEKMRKDMGEKLGINRQTATAEGLQKMLANRRISGKYKFQDGIEFAYTGSYERKTLEFFDEILNIKGSDLMIPGPPLQYILDGKKHIYIPDIYYIPYNLMIEVKDGGNRPNTNPQLIETRRRQVAKEEYIVKETNYNYIRLTNNDFSQIISVFADLKMSTMEEPDIKKARRVVHVNEDVRLSESMVSTIHAAIPQVGNNDVVVVNYYQNNVFAGKSRLAIADNIKFDSVFRIDDYDGKLKKCDKSFLEDCKYDTFIVDNRKNIVLEGIASNLNKEVDEHLLENLLFGHPLLSNDQLLFENVRRYEDFYSNINSITESTIKEIKGE